MAEPPTSDDDDAVFAGQEESKESSTDEKKDVEEWTTVDAPDDDNADEDDDNADEDDDNADEDASSKDLKNEIKIIHELMPITGGEPVTVDTSNDEHTPDPVQQVFENLTKTVKEPVRRGIDENVQKFQSAVEEHVKPHLDNFRAAIDDHVAPKLRDFQGQTSKGLEAFGNSTRSVMEDHVKPKMEHIQRSTAEGLVQTGKVFWQDIPGHSKRIVDNHVLPVVETFKVETGKTAERVSAASIESYQKHVQPQAEKAHKAHTSYSKYYMGTAPALFDENESRMAFLLAESSLRSFGKVVFCDSPVTGGFVMLGMLVGSPIVALCALASVISMTFCAKLLEMDLAEIKSGTLGYNAVLVGAGCAAFLQFEHAFLFGWMASFIMAGVVLPPMTLLAYLHTTQTLLKNTPPLLIPYNMVMIVFLLSAILWDRTLVVPATEKAGDVADATHSIMVATLNGLSAIFLVEGVWSGLLILVGATFFSRILAGALFLGSLVASLLSLLFGISGVEFNGGVAGYNAALTAGALVYFFEPSWKLGIVGMFAIVLTCLLEAAIGAFFWEALGLPITLTLAFCLATVALLTLDTEKYGLLKERIDGEWATPEEYLQARAAQTTNDNVVTLQEAPSALKEDEEDLLDPLEVDAIATEKTPLLTKGLDV